MRPWNRESITVICVYKRRRLPLARIQAAAEARGGLCLLQEYVNSSTPLQFECGLTLPPLHASLTGFLGSDLHRRY
jgi:hypothetical protein